jgi:hypothetical protein
MIMWQAIRLEASNLILKRLAHPQIVDIDQYILGAGYGWAPKPHESTIDLLTVYAANLRNTSGGGPLPYPFSLMIRAAVESEGVIEENQLVRPLDLSSFSKACAEYLGSSGAVQLAKVTTIDFRRDLVDLSLGRERKRAVLNGPIKSIVGFSELLVSSFGGSAHKFHQKIDCICDPSKTANFVVSCYEMTKHLPGVGGVALAMNFYKDSQVSSKKNSPLSGLVNTQVGWFVKPDMHILRFMLAATGRADSAGISDCMLADLKQEEATKLYVSYAPRKSWSNPVYNLDNGQPTDRIGQWRCVEDVHRFARHLQISPFEIDRILFMLGSGNFGENISYPARKNEVGARYAKFLPMVREVAGENSAEFDQFIAPIQSQARPGNNRPSREASLIPTGDFVYKKLKMGEWRGRVKLQKILKKRVSNDQDLLDAQKLISLLRSQKESNPSKSENFFEAICQALDAGATLRNFVKCAEGIPIENYDTQVKFIVKGGDVVSKR